MAATVANPPSATRPKARAPTGKGGAAGQKKNGTSSEMLIRELTRECWEGYGRDAQTLAVLADPIAVGVMDALEVDQPISHVAGVLTITLACARAKVDMMRAAGLIEGDPIDLNLTQMGRALWRSFRQFRPHP